MTDFGRRRTIGKEDYQAKGVMYLPPKARFSHLLALPEGENIGKAINEAMNAVETENEELKGVLPRTYTKIDNVILASLLKNFSQVAVDAEGDKFGKIYEYFLGNFARAEGQRGGEFCTPTTLVQLIVEVVEPHHGRIIDYSCGFGGMSVQSAKFIKSRLTASRRRRRIAACGLPSNETVACGLPLNEIARCMGTSMEVVDDDIVSVEDVTSRSATQNRLTASRRRRRICSAGRHASRLRRGGASLDDLCAGDFLRLLLRLAVKPGLFKDEPIEVAIAA